MAEAGIGRTKAGGAKGKGQRALADFRADPRLLVLAGMALLIGTAGAFAA